MLEVHKEQFIAALQGVGVQAGDGLLIHSAVQFLGRPVGGLGMYLEAIQAVIGPQSTLAVPAFNFAFARGEPFDPHETPSQKMGAFAEWVRTRPEALRTPHTMQSLAVIGAQAADLAGRDTPSAFDPGSAFERMLELDFKLLLLGADVNAISLLHYSEQRLNVPYRYWKDFRGQVRTPQGWEERTYRMFVRDMKLDPKIDLQPVRARLEQRGQWHSHPLNYGQIQSLRMRDFVTVLDEFLGEDPWSLVTNRPETP